MTHDAHIQSAGGRKPEVRSLMPDEVEWQLACEEWQRAQRRRELVLLTAENNALKALLVAEAKLTDDTMDDLLHISASDACPICGAPRKRKNDKTCGGICGVKLGQRNKSLRRSIMVALVLTITSMSLVAGRTNIVQASTNLTTWQNILTNTTGGVVTWLRTNSVQEFYRIKPN